MDTTSWTKKERLTINWEVRIQLIMKELALNGRDWNNRAMEENVGLVGIKETSSPRNKL